MSTQRGNNSRTRAQKYKNRTVFKNDLYDKTTQQKKLNAMNVSSVCHHCKGVIEWKIKYKKYKPLSQPKTCTRCLERKVNKAYHVLCRDCAVNSRCCAKCLRSADEVEIEPPGPTPEEEQKLKVEMDRLIKSLPERKRRAFLRFMEKGKQQEGGEENVGDDKKDRDDDAEGKEEAKAKPERIPHTRDELLRKIEELKMNTDEDDDDFGDVDDFFGDSTTDDEEEDDCEEDETKETS